MQFHAALAVLLLAPGNYPQAPDTRPQFDAASIKLNMNCGGRVNPRGGGPLTSEYYSTSCAPLRVLIRVAYAPQQHSFIRQTEVLGGASWLDTEVYDVAARAANIGTVDRWHAMLQRLLEDRCGLKIHKETREVPVYALTVAKGGPKMQPSKPGSCRSIPATTTLPQAIIPPSQPAAGEPELPVCGWDTYRLTGGTISRTGVGMTIDQFANLLLDRLDRLVVNRTGLAGMFDIGLEYASETAQTRPEGLDGAGSVPSASDPVPSVFTAVQQLGLKLSPDKGNVEVLVIDHVEKPSDS
jgi:uncharacterized protein (TIGR03435 family)